MTEAGVGCRTSDVRPWDVNGGRASSPVGCRLLHDGRDARPP
jgi:hypothetical protein